MVEQQEATGARAADTWPDHVFRSSVAGMVVGDVDLALVAINPALCRMLGYADGELIGRHAATLAHPDEVPVALALRERLLAGEHNLRLTRRRWARRDGSDIFVDVTVSASFDPSGTLVFGVGMVEDLTDQLATEAQIAASTERLDRTLEAATVLLWEFDIETARVETQGDLRAVCGFDGFEDLSEILARVHPEDYELLGGMLRDLHELEDEFAMEFRLRDDDGRFRSLLTRGWTRRDADGAPITALGVTLDISPERDAERGARESAETFARIIDLSPDGFIGIDAQDRITQWNRAAAETFGWSPDLVLGRPLVDLIAPSEAADAWSAMLFRADATHTPLPVRTRDGSILAAEVIAFSVLEGGLPARKLVVRDVTDQRAAAQRLSETALRDPLTGLPNSALFDERLRAAVAGLAGRDSKLAVLLVDVDRIRVINDSLGHRAGDQVIRDVGARIKAILAIGETVARVGGDEFAVLLPHSGDSRRVRRVADRIRGVIAQPLFAGGRQVEVTASLGVSFAEDPGRSPAEVMRAAYVSLARSKQTGETAFESADEAGDPASSLRRLELESDLRRALSEGQIEVWYQPVVTADDRVKGLEALARWRHPVHGLVSPVEFIPIAEESGLIVPVGAWILDEACRQLAAWRGLPGTSALQVAVNFSGRQLGRPDVVDQVLDTLERHGLPTDALGVEITESMLMADTEGAMQVLGRLHDAGVCLALDDFGTGYSSLTYLRQFPVSVLKIDQSFVRTMATDDADAAIVSALVGMARALGMQACAEGVEGAAELAMLRDLGCPLFQGYHWSRPLPAAEMERWLLDRSAVAVA